MPYVHPGSIPGISTRLDTLLYISYLKKEPTGCKTHNLNRKLIEKMGFSTQSVFHNRTREIESLKRGNNVTITTPHGDVYGFRVTGIEIKKKGGNRRTVFGLISNYLGLKNVKARIWVRRDGKTFIGVNQNSARWKELISDYA